MGKRAKKNIIPADESFELVFIALMLLLLCFMVIMVSLAQLDDPRFREAIGSVKGAFSMLSKVKQESMILNGGPGVLTARGQPRDAAEEAAAFEESMAEILGEDAPDMVRVQVTDAGIEITLGSVILFESGGSTVRGEAVPVLDEVASLITDWSAPTDVVGHTDDLPIHTEIYPSNWDLSVRRAVEVVRYLESRGVPGEMLRGVGRGSSSPIYANDSPKHRNLNRRVEVKLHFDDD